MGFSVTKGVSFDLTYGSTGVLTCFCTQILDGNKVMGVCEFSRRFQHFFNSVFDLLKRHGQPYSKNEGSNGLYLWSQLELSCQGHTAGAGRSLEFWLKIKTPSCQAPLFEGCPPRDRAFWKTSNVTCPGLLASASTHLIRFEAQIPLAVLSCMILKPSMPFHFFPPAPHNPTIPSPNS
jgi:hypothetical protein